MERGLLFRKSGETWYEYALVHSRPHCHGKNYTFSSLQEKFPPGTQLAKVVRMSRGRVWIALSASMRSRTNRPTNQCTLNKTLAEWVEECIWYHLYLAEGGELAWLLDAFRNGTALFICDGYYQPVFCRELGSAAWIINAQLQGRE